MTSSVLSSNVEEGWKNYDDFAAGIDTNRLPGSCDWANRTLDIQFDNQQILNLVFDVNRVTWSYQGESGHDVYEEVKTSENHYFFDLQLAHKPNESLTFVLNQKSGRVLAVRSVILAEGQIEEGSRLVQTFLVGSILGMTPANIVPAPTRELIGYRTLNVYSPNHYYEHFYVNSKRYAWQNLRGEQFGQGDMDYATCYKFEEDMYVFTFREKVIPVCSVFFFDYKIGRCTGKFLGLSRDNQPMVTRAGALIYKMSYNCYPVGVEPM
ncbi:MoaF C-terminal domain-containing protein [Iodobacter arcticus]|uniref:MoaF C-terminal domain-containing protein n=1 Tax=Iodobacter arcticus TaxID=590593 RepID=A0ABW2R0C9_9NEIS